MPIKLLIRNFEQKYWWIGNKETFQYNVIFSGQMNSHSEWRIWGSKTLYVSLDHVCGRPKLNVFVTSANLKCVVCYFFMEKTINGITYLDKIKIFLTPQWDVYEKMDSFTTNKMGLQLTSAEKSMNSLVNDSQVGWWINHAGLIVIASDSPDSTPLSFSYGESKVEVYFICTTWSFWLDK